jgi:tetratricopeptide (TPR) repeat protein
MESVEELRKKAAAVRAMIAEDESALAAHQDNFAHKLGLKSLKEHLADLLGQTGAELLNSGNPSDAEREFKEAVELKPATRGIFLHSILSNSGNDWAAAIPLLRMLVRIAPTYEHARDNLAIAFLNLGVEIVNNGSIEGGSVSDANEHFYLALGATTDSEILNQARKNFAASYTKLGTYYHEKGEAFNTLECMKRAREAFPDEATRRNLGVAYAHMARALMRERHFDQAAAQFENAEDTGVVLPELLNDYGVALVALGRPSEAKLSFERALGMAADNEVVRGNLTVLSSRETSIPPHRAESADEIKPAEGPPVEMEWDDLINVDDLQTEELFPDFIPIHPAIYQYQVAAA